MYFLKSKKINNNNNMSLIPLGIYQHIKTKNLYNVIGYGRSVYKPEKIIVIYEQLYESKLVLNNNTIENDYLPIKSIWTRDIDDYKSKFILLNENIY
jgi:hypothetical protein